MFVLYSYSFPTCCRGQHCVTGIVLSAAHWESLLGNQDGVKRCGLERFASHLLANVMPFTLAQSSNVGVLSTGYLLLPVSSIHFDASCTALQGKMTEAGILNEPKLMLF